MGTGKKIHWADSEFARKAVAWWGSLHTAQPTPTAVTPACSRDCTRKRKAKQVSYLLQGCQGSSFISILILFQCEKAEVDTLEAHAIQRGYALANSWRWTPGLREHMRQHWKQSEGLPAPARRRLRKSQWRRLLDSRVADAEPAEECETLYARIACVYEKASYS